MYLVMGVRQMNLQELESATDAALEEAASRLRELVAELASRLRPFPAFLSMTSIQAVELDPAMRPAEERGCMVVLPDGDIRELDLKAIPGIHGISEVDQVEEFRELELSAEEYIVFAASAVRALSRELRRRGL